MTDVQVTGRVQPKRKKAIGGRYEFVQMRPGRFVMSYDRWPANQVLEAEQEQLSIVNPPRPASDFSVLANWLVSVTQPFPRHKTERAPEIEQVEPELRDLVGRVLDEWRNASAHQSSMRRAAKHPYFPLIKKMGPLAIEMIIQRLHSDPNPLWIWSLGELTGEDPAGGAATIPEAAEAWVQWADQRSLD